MNIITTTVRTYEVAVEEAEEFYGRCQWDEAFERVVRVIKVEDQPEQSLVIVSDTWPIAVTRSNGGCHSPHPDAGDWDAFYGMLHMHRASDADQMIALLDKAREVATDLRIPLYL